MHLKRGFISPTDRLEGRYHTGLYKEFCKLKSTISSTEVSFKKKRGYNYFFLKIEQSGQFNAKLEEEVALNQLLFLNTNLHSMKLKMWTKQFVNVVHNDSIIAFAVRGNPEVKKWLEVIR